jgi:virginiamycin B lyase
MRSQIKSRKKTPNLIVGLAITVLAIHSQAGVVQGKINGADGKPIVGAMVTLTSKPGVGESVYTDTKGGYKLDTGLAGDLNLRVRKRYFRDDSRELQLGSTAKMEVDVKLAPLTDPQELSDAHPSLSHFSLIAFDEDETALFSRGNFARDCLTCHSLGNSFTRSPRPAEFWVPSVQRMHGYLASAEEAPIKERSKILAEAFNGRLATSRPEIPVDPLLFGATVHQWRLDDSVVPHDAEYSDTNGMIYSSDMFAGEVLETNIETGETLRFALPADGEPPGGTFTSMGLPAPYGLTISRAPHSLVIAPDGMIYMTDSIGAAVTSFDPVTRKFENFEVEGGALYPHTVRMDEEGVVWFSIAFSNQVGRFDTKTKSMKVITLPESPSLSIPGTSIPYGIAVSPNDGGVWYTKLASDKIGRIDPVTLEVKEYDSPVRGPRRQRFDAAGNLWVAGFSDGAVAKIDVANWKAKIYALPVYAEGEIPAPYALAINPVTQDVWVNDTMMDVVWRFLADEERFVAYPMPLRGTYTRDFTFTDKGWACTSNNPIPAAALEGGIPELICIDPGDSEIALSGL